MLIEQKKSILDTLRSMNVGDYAIFPASRAGAVRASASAYGFQWDRVYTTSTDRQTRTITVTRVS